MKKLMLSAAALMIGSLAFAQVTPTPPTGAQSLVPIANYSADPNANTGLSVQNGNDQKVRVRQVGTSNSAATYQDDGAGSGGNLALIDQDGAVNTNSGHANLAETHQKGSANEAITMQQGDGNNTLINQGMINTASSGNKALVQQGNNNQAEDNAAEVNQDGNDNQSRTLQRWDNNEALTTQFGNANKSGIDQAASPNNSEGHAAEVNQLGDGNQALLTQTGNGARNMATTIQVGDGNASVQNQFATGTINDGNNAFVDQGDGSVGSNIYGELFQGSGTYGLMDVDNIANGSFNPGSDGAIARQEQNGTNNIAEARQFGKFNQSYQEQDGDANRGLVVQNAFGNANGQSNRARQEQTGDRNDAAIGQNGSQHQAYQIQMGDDNLALSTQRGMKNLANINQFGDNNWATTAQRGECNQAVINQYDGQSYSIEQNLADGMPNGGNQADILQQGPGGTATGVLNCDIPFVDPGTFTDIPDLNLPDICPGC